jgi:hypothetical protein
MNGVGGGPTPDKRSVTLGVAADLDAAANQMFGRRRAKAFNRARHPA